MFQIGNIIAKLLLDKNMSFKPAAVHSFLSGMVIIIMIMFMVATLLSAVIIFSLLYIYYALLLTDIGSLCAFIITTSMALVIIAALVTLATYRIKKLQKLVQKEQPVALRLNSIVASFCDGFMNPKNIK